MSAMQIVITKLVATSAVTALVPASKIFPVTVGQGTNPPAITVSEMPRRDQPLLEGGASGYYEQRVTVDCMAETAEAGLAIANAVFGALHGPTKASISGFSDVDILEKGGAGSGYSDDRSLFTAGMDFSVRWRG